MRKNGRTLFFILLLVGLCVWFYNKKSTAHAPETIPSVATASPETPAPAIPDPLPVSTPTLEYQALTLTTDTPGKEIVTALGGYDNLAAFLSLNRVDDKHLQKEMTVVIPSTFEDPWAFTGFPRSFPALSTIPKIMLISQRTQEFGAYEYGQLVRFGGISTGKKTTPTKNGLYHTNWKAKETTSTVNDEWLLKWNFNIDNLDGIGIHEYELPGYPASHSCIRLSAADAEWFYNWADQWKLSRDEQTVLAQGTPVVIFGTYEFGVKAPWKKLAEDPTILALTDAEIQTITTAVAD